MSVASEGMEEIVQAFLAESAEGLDLLDRDLIELERNPTSRERLDEIFRAVHTIKGCSGMLGYPTLESVAHAGESVLARIRDGKRAVPPSVATALLAMVDAMRALLKAIELTGGEGGGNYKPLVRSLEDLLTDPSASAQAGVVASGDGDGTGDRTPVSLKSIGGSKIHVDAALLDRMMDLAGELILARNQLLRLIAGQNESALLSSAQQLKRVTTDIHEAVMKARLQPIGGLWNKFPRMARDLALSCGKQVRVEMEGSETELDRAMLEAVRDPLTHILRNAIDHGLETPEQRTAAGKMAAGRLRFCARHEHGQVCIEISDDGAGIDLARVRQRALERGLLTAAQAAGMGDQEMGKLIFAPGFSTAERVTNVSGRGVGLDVVKTNIERIGGMVDLQSLTGQGTTVCIKIPLTLAIFSALIVSSAGQHFAIPQVNLAEVVYLGAGSETKPVEQVCGAPVYRLGGQLLPLCVLARELHLGDRTADGSYIAVLRAGADKFGLVVDAVHDTEEIVVKPLGQHLQSIACFAGSAVLGDRRVALILDAVGLARMSGVLTSSPAQPPSQEREVDSGTPGKDVQRWLVCRGPSGSRFGVPLSAVTRLEEIPAARVEQSAGREVMQHDGGILPLLRAATLFDEPEKGRELLQVAVLHQSGHRAGLVVDRIEDIVEQVVGLCGGAQGEWLQGAAVIQGQVTDVLNLENVLAHARAGHSPAQTVDWSG